MKTGCMKEERKCRVFFFVFCFTILEGDRRIEEWGMRAVGVRSVVQCFHWTDLGCLSKNPFWYYDEVDVYTNVG